MVLTDHFSTNLEQRLFSAETPPKISEKYQRFPAVEKQINEVLQLSEKEFLQRLAINNRESDGFLQEETLVCLLSLAHSENLSIENQLAERLFALCEKRIRTKLKNQSYSQNFIDEVFGDLRAQMLQQILNRTHESYDFWEARFYKALKSLIYTYLRKHSQNERSTKLFGELFDESEGEFENRLASETDLADEVEIKETNRKILGQMPKDLRIIFLLYYRDGETQKTIAETLGITDRTVRNKLDRISDFLNKWRSSDGEIK